MKKRTCRLSRLFGAFFLMSIGGFFTNAVIGLNQGLPPSSYGYIFWPIILTLLFNGILFAVTYANPHE